MDNKLTTKAEKEIQTFESISLKTGEELIKRIKLLESNMQEFADFYTYNDRSEWARIFKLILGKSP